MKKILIAVIIMPILVGFTMQAQANLTLLGQGTSIYGTYNLIYDTNRDITWFDYTNAAATWQDQINWADALSVTFGSNTYIDWRLPTSLNQDGSGPCNGYDCTGSEMGHLYYTELNNVAEGGLNNVGVFQDLQSQTVYWSGTPSGTKYAWYFSTYAGNQNAQGRGYSGVAIAVRTGLAVVPEPISSILFITGGTLLAGRRFIRRRHNKSLQ